MTEEMQEDQPVVVDEQVVLSKFEHPDGETTTEPQFEVERLTVSNGEVVSHDKIENGEVVGPVPEEENLTGKDVGKLFAT